MSTRTTLLLPFLLILASQCGQLSGYSRGGPKSQCGSMTPGHNLAPQTSSSPFEVQVKILQNIDFHFIAYLVILYLNFSSAAIRSRPDLQSMLN